MVTKEDILVIELNRVSRIKENLERALIITESELKRVNDLLVKIRMPKVNKILKKQREKDNGR